MFSCSNNILYEFLRKDKVAIEPLAGVSTARGVRWCPEKRKYYVSKVTSPQCESARAAVLSKLSTGQLGVNEACQQWCDIINGVAHSVFGMSSGFEH